MTATFISDVLQGHATIERIDDYIDEWHEIPESSISLREFLGLSVAEHTLWLSVPEALRSIIFCRQKGYRIVEGAS